MKTVIVGGVAGGMSTAARLRRLDEQHEIVVLERSGHVSYANCGLPYHVGGTIAEREALLLQSPRRLRDRFALDVRVRSEVVAIDRARRQVRVRELPTGREYDEGYDRLVLSPGAVPVVPDVDGIDRALTLRTVEDMDRIRAAATAAGARSAVVVGGGFIGLEMAENLRDAGLAVALVEQAPQVLTPLDVEMAALVQDELRAHDVELHLGTSVAGVGAHDVTLADGRRLPADVLLLAIGVRPDTRLAAAAGLELGPRGGIAVDEQLRTSDPHVYAVGDAAEKRDALTDAAALVPLANLANRHGRLVADAIAGRPVDAGAALGTAVVRVFGLTAGVVGWSERRLRAAGIDFVAVHTHGTSHATYYPGAERLSLKLLAAPDGRLLGAQAVGRDGVDKRIDVLATAMRGGLAAADLAALELAYAPQTGTAKDAVNILGYVADNRLRGDEPAVQWYDVPPRPPRDDEPVLLDVRTAAELRDGAIPGAVHIPLDELRARVGELPRGRRIVTYCTVSQRAHVATMLLRGHGRDAATLDGGWVTWRAGWAAAEEEKTPVDEAADNPGRWSR